MTPEQPLLEQPERDILSGFPLPLSPGLAGQAGGQDQFSTCGGLCGVACLCIDAS
jgi:hypothetical protein